MNELPMRYPLLLVGASVLVLTACVSHQGLPADQVLKKAAGVGQNLESADFDGVVDFNWKQGAASYMFHLILNGTLNNAGRDTQLGVAATGTIRDATQSYDIDANVQTISLDNGENVYLKLDKLDTSPAYPPLSGKQLLSFMNRWWKLPSDKKPADAQAITPDPRLLRAQTEIVSVTSDHGIRSVDGHNVYMYDVTIDHAKLAAFLRTLATQNAQAFDESQTEAFWQMFDAKGSLEINADTFAIEQLTWKLEPTKGSEVPAITFTIHFSNQNHAANIAAPPDYTVYTSTLLPQTEASQSEASASSSISSGASSRVTSSFSSR